MTENTELRCLRVIASQLVRRKAPPDDRLREAIHGAANEYAEEWIASSQSAPRNDGVRRPAEMPQLNRYRNRFATGAQSDDRQFAGLKRPRTGRMSPVILMLALSFGLRSLAAAQEAKDSTIDAGNGAWHVNRKSTGEPRGTNSGLRALVVAAATASLSNTTGTASARRRNRRCSR